MGEFEMTNNKLILAIETSCDETSVSVIKNGTELLSNTVLSQIDSHKRFGGVVPEVASRHHVEGITATIDESLVSAEIGWRLIPEVWGNGLATEGAEAVMKYARDKGIKELYSFTSENNLPSRKVMEKLGMTFLDNFEYPNLSKYHPLKRHVRYYKELLPS
ncbi:GNAT family N-acetyltransferase [Micromonospora chersina]